MFCIADGIDALLLSVLRLCEQEYARLFKDNFPTIDAAARPMHLFQMTVSATHSVNLAGLHAAMAGLGLIAAGGGAAAAAAVPYSPLARGAVFGRSRADETPSPPLLLLLLLPLFPITI
jgi:hypothetical protein